MGIMARVMVSLAIEFLAWKPLPFAGFFRAFFCNLSFLLAVGVVQTLAPLIVFLPRSTANSSQLTMFRGDTASSVPSARLNSK